MAPEILYYAIPGFLILLLLEAWYSWKENKALFETKDTWSSLAMGIGNVISGFVSKLVVRASPDINKDQCPEVYDRKLIGIHRTVCCLRKEVIHQPEVGSR